MTSPSLGDVDANVLRGERVAISATPGPEFIAAVHAAWMCGAIAVPIARGHTRDEVEHVLNDSGAVAFAVVPDRPTLADDNAAAADRWATAADRYVRIHDDAVESSGVRATVLVPRVPSADEERASPPLWPAASLEPYASPRPDDGAILIYTSGTTGQPKGALHTHVTLEAQCDALRAAWGWRRDDRILHALPLHHIHGLVNAWMCLRAPPAPSLSSVRTRRVSHRVPRGSVSARARNVARRSPCSWGCPDVRHAPSHAGGGATA